MWSNMACMCPAWVIKCEWLSYLSSRLIHLLFLCCHSTISPLCYFEIINQLLSFLMILLFYVIWALHM